MAKEKKEEYYHYFWDDESGEEFYVLTDTEENAKEIAEKYFENPKYDGIVEDWVAEISGYDVY